MKEKPLFSDDKNTLIIAELGTSHSGDLSKAKEMTDAAAEAGADYVKFQMVYADEILHPNTGFVDLPGGKTSLYERFKSLECPPEFYEKMKEYCKTKGLDFLCTPFGPKSASILKKMQPRMVKIASPELNYTGLLEEVSGWNIPILLSTGVSTLADIDKAVRIIKEKMRQNMPSSPFLQNSLCLLHCVTAYPAPETDYNLWVLYFLSRIFDLPVGVSDHSLDPALVPVLSVCMGAAVIEKHFCLSRDDPGLDDPIALPPDEFAKMVKAVRSANMQLYADNEREKNRDMIFNMYAARHGEEKIMKILGTGIKELAPSEKANYGYTNRSIHALRDIKTGEVIRKGDYAVLRSEKNLRPGLEPCMEKLLEGRVAKNDIPRGEGIRFEDV